MTNRSLSQDQESCPARGFLPLGQPPQLIMSMLSDCNKSTSSQDRFAASLLTLTQQTEALSQRRGKEAEAQVVAELPSLTESATYISL